MKYKQILRWMFCIPAGLLAAIIVRFPIHYSLVLTFQSTESVIGLESVEQLERFLTPLIVPGVFIYLSAYIAPKFHFAVSIIATMALICFLIFMYIAANNNNVGMYFPVVRWAISSVFAIVCSKKLDNEQLSTPAWKSPSL